MDKITEGWPEIKTLINLLIQANQLRLQEKYDEAISLYLKSIEQYGEDVGLLHAIAITYFMLLKSPEETGSAANEARKWLERALSLDPNNSHLHAQLAQIHEFGLSDYQKAVEEFDKALEANPRNITALVGKAALYGPPDSPITLDQAITCLEMSVKWEPDDPNLHARLGELYFEKDRPRDAFGAWINALTSTEPLSEGFISIIKDGLK
jgi:tetratricopeptide (TPR) repeat protein